MKPFARINLSSAALRRLILVSSLALAAGCCTVDRTGEYYVATKSMTRGKFPPSVGAFGILLGANYPLPCFPLIPVGFACYGAEIAVFAPVWDTLCLPVDMCRRDNFLKSERKKKEQEEELRQIRELLDSNISVALADESFYEMPRRQELSRWLYRNAKEGLTSEQALFIANKIRKNQQLFIWLSDVLKSDALPGSEIEWFFREAIDAKNIGDVERARRLADGIAQSGRATDEQLAELKRLDLDAFSVDEEIKRRAENKLKGKRP